MRSIVMWLFAAMVTFSPMYGLGQEAVKTDVKVETVVEGIATVKEVTAEVLPSVADVVEEVPVTTIVAQLMKVVTDWKSFGWQMGLMALITLLLSTIKNSFLRGLIWDKLGSMKVFAAPALSLIIVLLGMNEWNLGGVFVALTTGMGAVALHQVFDAIKAMPGIGSIPLAAADMLGKLLKAPDKKV